MKLLLKSGATVNLCDKNEASPLEGHESVVHFLLDNGANVNLCLAGGVSSFLLARENGNDNIVQWFIFHVRSHETKEERGESWWIASILFTMANAKITASVMHNPNKPMNLQQIAPNLPNLKSLPNSVTYSAKSLKPQLPTKLATNNSPKVGDK